MPWSSVVTAFRRGRLEDFFAFAFGMIGGLGGGGGECLPVFRFREGCSGSREDFFRAFWGGRRVGFGGEGVNDALVFGGDGFSGGPSGGFLGLCLRHDRVVGRGRGKAWEKKGNSNSINSVEFMLVSYFSG